MRLGLLLGLQEGVAPPVHLVALDGVHREHVLRLLHENIVEEAFRRHSHAVLGVARRVLLATGSGVTVQRDRIELPAETAAIVAL